MSFSPACFKKGKRDYETDRINETDEKYSREKIIRIIPALR
jgi:hypothetical protein